MINAKNLNIKNIVYFKKAQVNFNSGLVVINGKNGAGKSLLFSSLPTLLYSALPLSYRKKSKKDILSKDSKIHFSFENEDKQIEITQASSAYKIKENGIDLNPRTIPIAENHIKNLFPITSDEFYSYVYIQSQRPCSFQTGSCEERAKYITQVFKLNNYDILKTYFSKKLQELKEDEARYGVLKSQYLDNLKTIKEIGWDEDKYEELKDLKSLYSELEDKLNRVTDKLTIVEKNLEGIKSIKHIDDQLNKLRDNYPFKKSPDQQLLLLKEQLTIAREWEKYKIQLNAYTETSRKIRDKLNLLSTPEHLLKECEEILENTYNKLDHYQEIKEELEEKYSSLQSLRSKKKSIEKELQDLNCKTNYKNIDRKIAEKQSILRMEKLLHHHEGNITCPTCLSNIDRENLIKLLEEAKDSLPKLLSIKKFQELHKELDSITESINSMDYSPQYHEKINKVIMVLKNKGEDFIKAIETWRLYNNLQKTLKSLEKPEQPEQEISYSSQEIEEYIDLCQTILKHLHAKKSVIHSYPDLKESIKNRNVLMDFLQDLEEKRNMLTDRQEKSQRKTESVYKNIKHLEKKITRYKIFYQQNLNYKKGMDELESKIENKYIYKHLVQAYGPKGLKINVLGEITSLLQNNMNLYSSYIFPEKFTFDINSGESGIDVAVDRGNNVRSDVRLLSGAESNCFRLLFLISMISLIPAARRTNFLILDEPLCHAHEDTKDKFINDFLPKLKEIIPNVFIITPEERYDYPDASYWRVIKEKGVSNLIKKSLEV